MKQINYEKFQQALEEQRSLSFINLKNDIEKVKGIIEKTLEAAKKYFALQAQCKEGK